MWRYVFMEQFLMVIFQKLSTSVNVLRFLKSLLSKILKIKIICKFAFSCIQCNTRTTGDIVQTMKCQINKTAMCAEQ